MTMVVTPITSGQVEPRSTTRGIAPGCTGGVCMGNGICGPEGFVSS